MRLVIDANILVAAFLKAATTRSLLLDESFKLFSPQHLLVEGRKVLKERLSGKRELTESIFDQLFSLLTNDIQVLAKEEYASYFVKALEIAPHKEDTPYLACALHLGAPLWSNDAGMKDQSLVKVLSTTELLEELKKC